jgi:hypothetical protein
MDRVFINGPWDDILPDSSLVSLPRTTSDHFPLLQEISTNIPKPKVFRYYNNWIFKVWLQGSGVYELALNPGSRGCSRKPS